MPLVDMPLEQLQTYKGSNPPNRHKPAERYARQAFSFLLRLMEEARQVNFVGRYS